MVDTDYDYYILEQIIAKMKPEWTLSYSENVILARYSSGNALLVDTSCDKNLRLSDDELETFWQTAVEIYEQYRTHPVQDELNFELYAPFKAYHSDTKEYTVCPVSTIYKELL